MRLAAYGRVSTNKDDQLDSLENQVQFFSEYARRTGDHLVRVYADEGISGKSLKNRTEFLRLMEDAERKLFDGVVVKDVSRFARNTVDFLQSIRELKALGINIKFITANMESLGESEFILTIFGAMAQEEIANLSKRVKFGKRINSQKGRVPPRIYGYDRVDNFTLRINEEEADVVRRIFDLYVSQGLGCRTIAAHLNGQKIRTRFGCDWNTTGIKRIIANPIYCGHYINHKYESESYLTNRVVKTPEAEHFHHERPEWAIVSQETFRKAQEQLQIRRKQYENDEVFCGGRYSGKHVFSTLIKCEHCGRSFCRKRYSYRSERVYWKCPTNDQYTAEKCDNFVKLNEEDLLHTIREYLASMIQDKEAFVQSILADVKNRMPQGETGGEQAERIERKILDLSRRKEKYQEMYANDVISMEELKQKTDAIQRELEKLEYNLSERERADPSGADLDSLAKSLREAIDGFLRLDTITNVGMRKIVDKISVNKGGNVYIFIKNSQFRFVFLLLCSHCDVKSLTLPGTQSRIGT